MNARGSLFSPPLPPNFGILIDAAPLPSFRDNDLPDRVPAVIAKEPRWSAPWTAYEVTFCFTYDDPQASSRRVVLRVLPPRLPLHPHYIPVFVFERVHGTESVLTIVDVLDPIYSHMGCLESGDTLAARRRSDTVEFVRLMQRAVLSALTDGMARERRTNIVLPRTGTA